MAFLTFPRAAKALIGSKLRATSTGVSLATPWGSHLDFDVSTTEAAELASLFEGLAQQGQTGQNFQDKNRWNHLGR